MKRLFVPALAVSLFFSARAFADVTFTWTTGSGAYLIYDRTGTNPLTPYQLSYTGAACFAQLIIADGAIHFADPEGNGVTGGDQVLATTWIGRGYMSSSSGKFKGAVITHDLSAGTKLYMRVWNAASPDYDGSATHTNASIPTGTNVYYGDSALYTTVSDPSGVPMMEDFILDDVGVSIVADKSLDADQDSMPDQWELGYFTNLTQMTAASDSDGDGLIDRYEYPAGTQPTNAASCLAMGRPTVSTQQVVVVWQSASGMTYSVETTTNLLAGFSPAVSNLAATPPTNSYSFSASANETRTFYRVRLEK